MSKKLCFQKKQILTYWIFVNNIQSIDKPDTVETKFLNPQSNDFQWLTIQAIENQIFKLKAIPVHARQLHSCPTEIKESIHQRNRVNYSRINDKLCKICFTFDAFYSNIYNIHSRAGMQSSCFGLIFNFYSEKQEQD